MNFPFTNEFEGILLDHFILLFSMSDAVRASLALYHDVLDSG